MIQSLFEMVVGAGWVAPLDFWKMRPGDVWWTIIAHLPNEKAPAAKKAETFNRLKNLYETERSKDLARLAAERGHDGDS